MHHNWAPSMAATCSHIHLTKLATPAWSRPRRRGRPTSLVRAQQVETQSENISIEEQPLEQKQEICSGQTKARIPKDAGASTSCKRQEHGQGVWRAMAKLLHTPCEDLRSIFDPVTLAFDQTQMDKLTLMLDPTNEFVWTSETCNKVYAYFQDLVDHYEGAHCSDIEHYIRKL